jgi:LTXXQ motif family protein
MKGTSQCLAVCVIILSAALVSVALARGGGRGGGRSLAAVGALCLSGARLDRSLSTIDVLIKPNGSQKAALEELKKAAKEYSDNMLQVCASDNTTDIPAKLAAADKHLDVALTGVRKLKPAAEKFYLTLNDDQKAQANLFLDLPGQ